MSSDLPDLYAVLGLPRTATTAEIRARYRDLIREERPDSFAGERARAAHSGDHDRVEQLDTRIAQAQERSRLLKLAYEILGSPRKRKKYDQGEVVRQVPRPPMSPLDRLRPVPKAEADDAPRLVFDQPTVDFGVVARNNALVQYLNIDNLGGIPSVFTVDWEQPVPWATLTLDQTPDEIFPARVEIRIDTGGLNYGRYRLRLIFTVNDRTIGVPVTFDLHSPAVKPTRPANDTFYSPPDLQPDKPARRSGCSNMGFLIAPAVAIMVAMIVCPFVLSATWDNTSDLPSEDSLTLTAYEESFITPTRQKTARPPSTPQDTAAPTITDGSGQASATPGAPTVQTEPTLTSTARPAQIDLPSGWKTVPADYTADDANWRPVPRTPFVIGGDAKLIFDGGTIQWILPAWVSHEWWLVLVPPGDGADQLISARIQILSGEPTRFGLVTAYEDENHYKTFVIDPQSNTYTISRNFPSGESRIEGGVLPKGTDPANVVLSVLMADGSSTFMIDDEVVYESDTLTTDGRVGFYATIAPYSKISLSIDNMIIAIP